MGEGPKWLAGSVVGAGLFWHRLFLTFSVGLAASLFFLFIFFSALFFLFPYSFYFLFGLFVSFIIICRFIFLVYSFLARQLPSSSSSCCESRSK